MPRRLVPTKDQALVYILLVALVALGLWRYDKLAEEGARERAKILVELCEGQQANRQVLRDLVNQGADSPLTVPEGADPALRKAIESAVEAGRKSREAANKRLDRDEVDCADIEAKAREST